MLNHCTTPAKSSELYRHLPETFKIDVKKILVLFSLMFWLAYGTNPIYGQSGNCTNDTPFYLVDLTGQPGGSFTTPTMNRDGNCCGAASNTNCVEFEVYLDSRSAGLSFDIVDGPTPSGSMFYQIGCGDMVPVGDSICVEGIGPHTLTLCMPGNAQNQFQVSSIIAFEEVNDFAVTVGCSAVMAAPLAFDPTTVSYNDITGGGTYNSYLSCVSGCDSTTVTPAANAPPFVDYLVCGNSNSGACTDVPFCDTIRVSFFERILVTVDPSPALICPSGSTQLQGQVTGGSGGGYTYIWYNGPDGTGSVVGNALSYTATTAGTYSFEVQNENYPDCEPFMTNVVVSDNFAIDAGVDQTICADAPAQLNGLVQGATGGVWSGGTGTFSPDNATLNATYTPTQSEIDAGSVTLTLTSTGNGTCAAGTDQMIINFHPDMTLIIDGPPTLCNTSTTTLTATTTGGSGTYSYLWGTGETTASVTKPAGTYSVMVTDQTTLCQVSGTIIITQLSGPTSMAASSSASSCGAANGGITVTTVTGGITPYSYSIDDISYQNNQNFNGLLAGSYTVYAQDANGCTVNTMVTVNDVAGPSSLLATHTPASCNQADGSLTVTSVTGGLAPYEYSLDATNFQASTTFSNLFAGSYDVTVRDANGCTYLQAVTVSSVGGPDNATITATAASCSDDDGSLIITNVTNGLSPYQYSIDATNYQSGTTLSGLASGSHTVYIRDANGCVYTQAETVPSEAPTLVSATAGAATCSLANGSITVQSVTGGIAPYAYSLDGIQFQSSTNFSGLAPGNYTLTAQDDNGCTITTDLVILDAPGPSTLEFTSQSSSCGASNGALTVTAVTGGTTPYQYSLDGINYQAGTVFGGLGASAYTITVRDANGCLLNTNAAVNDLDGPTALTASSSTSTCGQNNGAISVDGVTGGVAPYTYALDGGTFKATGTFNNIFAGSHTVSAKDVNGCIVSASIVVDDIAGPVDFNEIMTSSTCGGSDGSIVVSGVTQGTVPYLYAIDGGAYQTGSSFTSLSAGSYDISVKDANDCEFTKTISVTNDGGPDAITYSTTQANCGMNDGSITIASVNGGDPAYTYSIDGINFQASNLFANLAFGPYDVTILDSKGCQYVEEVFVPSEGPESMDLQVRDAVCSEDNASITINSTSGGTSPYTYSIDGTTYQVGPMFAGLAIGTHTVYVQDSKGCILTQVVTIEDNPGPQDLLFSLQDATCGNANGQFVTDNVVGGTAPFVYALDGGAFQSNSTIQNIAEGSHSVIVEDANGCQFAVSFSIINIAGPAEVTASTTPSDCNQNNGVIEVSGVTGGTAPFTYSIDGTNFQGGLIFNGLAQGQYTVSARDANNCSVSLLVDVANNDGPQAFTNSVIDETCGQLDGSITIDNVIGGEAPYLYAIGNDPFQNSASFSGLATGTYTIYIQDAKNCLYEEPVTVGSTGPTAVDFSSTPASCSIDDATVTINGVTGGTFPYSYSIDGAIFQSNILFTGLAAGNYTLITRDANACTYIEDIIIGGQGPEASLDSLRHISCNGSSDGYININATGTSLPLSYSIDNGVTFQSESEFLNLGPGVYDIQVIDNNGCTTSVNDLEISEPELLQAEAGILQMPDPGLANGVAYLSIIQGGIPPYNITLNGENMGQDSLFQNLAGGTYAILLQDQNQCSLNFEVIIESTLTEIEIPNGFTPNGDGRNDTWEMANLYGLYPQAEVQVFNRWGQMIFFSDDYNTGWDGKKQGKELPTATYYYVISLTNDIDPLKGTVTIIR